MAMTSTSNDCAHLRGWTPIALGLNEGAEPRLEWADLRGHAFAGRSLSRILHTWRAGTSVPKPTLHTPLSALEALDEQPSLDPDLIIAHPSRCGSTLLARMASARPDTLLISEPALLPQLLGRHANGGLGRPVTQVVRQAVRAQGRIRFGTERRYVLKLNSQSTRFLPELRKAFPDTPVVWLQRRPAEVIESNLAMLADRDGDGADPEAQAGQVLRRVTLAFLAATAFVDEQVLVLDYRDLPDAAWTQVADLMGLPPPDPDDLARMRAVTEVHAHSGAPFVPRTRASLPAAVQAVVVATLDPMYRTLAQRGKAPR